MLRLAVVSWRAPGDPDAGGSELHASEILGRVADAGHEVTVFARRPPTPNHTGHLQPFRIEAAGGTYGVFAAAPAQVIRERRRFDTVVEILNGVPFWSPLWWRGPRVVWLHHLHTEMWAQSLPRPLADVGRWNERLVVPRVYASTPVVTLAGTGRDELVRAGFRRVEAIAPGVDARFTPSVSGPAPAGPPRLVAVGRLVPVKRWPELLEAIAPLAERFPGLRLDVVGDGPLRSELERWKAERAASWMSLHGRLTDDELVALYRAADLVVSASSAEGWGMTITEAARCGTPAVVTDVTGHRAAVVDGATGVIVPSPSDLTFGIEALLLDHDRRRRLGRAASDRAERMTWDEAASRHLAVLEETSTARRSVRFRS